MFRRLYLIGTCSTDYIAEETPTPIHYNAHLALEHLRLSCKPPIAWLPYDDPVHLQPQADQEDETYGPRVLIIGESGSGKSTLAKSLINWALRAGRARRDGDWQDPGSGRKVLFVNLDPSDVSACVTHTSLVLIIPCRALLPCRAPSLQQQSVLTFQLRLLCIHSGLRTAQLFLL